MRDTRDLRDPQSVGEEYTKARMKGVPPGIAAGVPAKAYRDGRFMSADPAEHHSKTPQNIDLWDGGE